VLNSTPVPGKYTNGKRITTKNTAAHEQVKAGKSKKARAPHHAISIHICGSKDHVY